MRFLCLHGAGTNNRIFEKQTAVLRRELGSGHTYEFVEGTVPVQVSDDIKGVASHDDEFYAYYRPFDNGGFRVAIERLGEYLHREGPFGGLIAFSQGTSLAAAYLIEQRLAQQGSAPVGDQQQKPLVSQLRCAVFVCGRLPYLDAGQECNHGREAASSGTALSQRPQEPSETARLLRGIHSVHIWGANDAKEPGQGQALHDLFGLELSQAVVHEGGHEVPSSRMPKAVYESARCIREMIARCEES